MTRLPEAAQEIVSFLQSQGWSCCIVGGMAVPCWGEPRPTEDVDICLLTGLGDESSFLSLLLKRFAGRVENADEFAVQNRVLLLSASNAVGVDVALAWTPFEEKMVARAAPYEFEPGVVLPAASAEDLVVTKAFADRRRDWVDIEGIVARQRGRLDWDYILRELSVLCELKEAPEIIDELKQIRVKIDAE